MTAVYRDMDAATLEREYAIDATVPDTGIWLRDYRRRSDAVRARRTDAKLGIAYGDDPAHRLDLFPTTRANAPILFFVHGGGWRASSKEDRSFPADWFCAHGAHFISVEYPLAPAAPVDGIVSAVRAAYRWCARAARDFGGDASRIVLAGNSAGGHLSGMLATSDWAAEGVLPPAGIAAISGVFDMEPLRLTAANGWLKLDEASVARNSPLNHLAQVAAGTRLVAAVGEGETAEFIRQSVDFHAAWTARGLPGRLDVLAHENHFSIIEAMTRSGHPVAHAVLDLLFSQE